MLATTVYPRTFSDVDVDFNLVGAGISFLSVLSKVHVGNTLLS